MITVCCVLKTGGVYTWDWVLKLARGVRAHLDQPHRFVCYTDAAEESSGVHAVPLRHGWPGWWSKVEVFRPVSDDVTLFLDLDTIVVGDLAPLLEIGDGLTMATDFYQPRNHNSSAMAWRGDLREIYGTFLSDPRGEMDEYTRRLDGRIGDQAFIEDTASKLNRFAPGLVASYKVHARNGPPEGAAVVTFHGSPKPNDPMAGWANQRWMAS